MSNPNDRSDMIQYDEFDAPEVPRAGLRAGDADAYYERLNAFLGEQEAADLDELDRRHREIRSVLG